MRFIPEVLKSQQGHIYLSDIYELLITSKLKPLALSWALACKQTDCITAGISKRADPTPVLTPCKHKTFVWL